MAIRQSRSSISLSLVHMALPIAAKIDCRLSLDFQIERACDGEHAFDVIVMHSYSRFFRDAFEQEFHLRKLAKQGVKLVSIWARQRSSPQRNSVSTSRWAQSSGSRCAYKTTLTWWC